MITGIESDGRKREILHGDLVSIDGFGLLITGESGSGKSDCALGLLSRGHKLVADDVISMVAEGGKVFGRPPKRFEAILRIHGLGIFDCRQVFGQSSFQPLVQISFCVELSSDLAGLDLQSEVECIDSFSILGVSIPRLRLRNIVGRDLPLLVETAVRVHCREGSLSALVMAEHDELILQNSVS